MSAGVPWPVRFLRQARDWSTYSKDGGLKVGAVITKGKRGVSWGFNGLPQGVPDEWKFLDDSNPASKGMKNRASLHAEENAAIFACRSLVDHTIYLYPRLPCAHCQSMLIQYGLRHIVWTPGPENPVEKSSWAEDAELSEWLRLKSRTLVATIPLEELD